MSIAFNLKVRTDSFTLRPGPMDGPNYQNESEITNIAKWTRVIINKKKTDLNVTALPSFKNTIHFGLK